jgi:D-erythro-7,8-dihydroneopterin triphosphate epimerase
MMDSPGLTLDRIEIKDLLVRGVIGINSEERRDRQDMLINIVMWVDFHKAVATDDVNDTVNYRTITKRIIEHVENSQYYLVETLAERIAEICLQDDHVQKVQVGLDKPSALRFARSVGVSVVRSK